MGNSLLNALCNGSDFTAFGTYYTSVCQDSEFRIEESLYLNTVKSISLTNPNYTLWPIQNATDIDPVFFEESPDPLPTQSVSGYPISIQFNDEKVENISVTSFELLDADESVISDVLLMTQSNDPNTRFDEYEYSLFPLTRLEWNTLYKVRLTYSATQMDDNSTLSETLAWQFKTKALPYAYYKITQNDFGSDFLVESNQTYAFYFEPQNTTDVINGYSTSFPQNLINEIDFYDQNTLYVKITGELGDTLTLTLSDTKTISVKIASNDTAIYPPIQNSNYANLENLADGWHLLGAIDDISLEQLSQFKIVWKYNGSWQAYSSTNDIGSFPSFTVINKDEGFWVLK